jgi:hypothetical protein
MAGPVEGRDPAGKPLSDSKMRRFPGDFLAETNQSARYSGHGSFVCACRRCDVEIDVTRQVET